MKYVTDKRLAEMTEEQNILAEIRDLMLSQDEDSLIDINGIARLMSVKPETARKVTKRKGFPRQSEVASARWHAGKVRAYIRSVS